jgi:hypothetical protein
LRRQYLLRQRANVGHLGLVPVEALHDLGVAQDIAGALGDFLVQPFHLGLRLVGPAHRQSIEQRKTRHQAAHQQRELPIDGQRQRHHHQDRQQRRQMFAQEAEPDDEQTRARRVHDAQQPARVMLPMEGQRQPDGVLEELRDHGEPAAVGEPVRLQRHPDACRNSQQAEAGPERDVPPG